MNAILSRKSSDLLTIMVLIFLAPTVYASDVGIDSTTTTTAASQTATVPSSTNVSRNFVLTFDDGPVPGKTERVLAFLAKLKTAEGQPVKAAFFMVGDAPKTFWNGRKYYAPYEIWIHKGSMRDHPELVTQVLQAGHFIGCHTEHHAWFRWPWLSSEADVTQEITNWEIDAGGPIPNQVKLFRPPYLVRTPAVNAAVAKLGYRFVLGHTVGDASPANSVADIEKNILHILASAPSTEEPVILIFHDIFPTADQHLDEIVAYIQQHGGRLQSFETVLQPAPITANNTGASL